VLATVNASAAAKTRTHRLRFLAGSAEAESKAPESTKVGGMEGSGRVLRTVGSGPLNLNPAYGGAPPLGRLRARKGRIANLSFKGLPLETPARLAAVRLNGAPVLRGGAVKRL